MTDDDDDDTSAGDALSLDEAMNELGFGRFQARLTAVMALTVAGEAMAFFTVSYLLPFASCGWHPTQAEYEGVSVAFFVGLILGNYVWGALGDLVGRQRCLLLTQGVLVYFSLLSALAPSYAWFTGLRAVVGFAIAGIVSTAYPLYMELTPGHRRHLLFLIHPVAGALAGVLLYAAGWWLIPRLGWRFLAAASTLPSLLALLLTLGLVPRSPRHLLLRGDAATAHAVLEDIARANGRPVLRRRLQAAETADCCSPHEWGLARMFRRPQLRLTLVLLVTWLCAGLLHYGTALLGLVLPPVYRWRCPGAIPAAPGLFADRSCDCAAAENVLLLPLVGGALGEAASLLFPGVMARLLGRRVALGTSAGLAGALCLLHGACKSPVGISALLFAQRAATTGLFLTCVLYATEAYPTSGRGGALGLGSAVGRVGNLLAPYVVEVLLARRSLWAGLGLMAGAGLLVCLLAPVLPFETRGRPLYETFDESEAAEAAARKEAAPGATVYHTFDAGQGVVEQKTK